MAEKSTPPPYVPGGSAMAQAANAEYQKALEDMLTALDARKTRLFDPQLLAMAKGFAAPTKSGSFFESLGNAAGEAGTAQAEQEKENREIAQAKLGLAGQKMGLLRQQESDKMLQDFLKSRGRPGFQSAGVTPGVTPGGAPAGAPGVAPATGPRGYQIAPGNPSFVDPWEYVAMARRMDPNANVADLLKKASEMQQGQTKTTDRGTYDMTSGMYYPAPGTDVREITLAGIPGKTFKVPEVVAQRVAQLYDDALNSNDWGAYQQLAQRIAGGPTAAPAAAPAQPAKAPAQAAGAPAQAAKPGAPMTGGMPSVQDIQTGQRAAETLETERAKAAAKFEQDWPAREAAAREMYSTASRVEKRLADSGGFVGIFDRMGLMPALGKLMAGGFNTGTGGTFNVSEFESAIRNMNSAITDQDIANVNLIASDLSNIELNYSRLYLKGDGPITEGERAIVRRIGGTTSENPKSLEAKMKLIKLRSQFDMDWGEAWNKYIQNNPDGNWTKFERTEGRVLTNKYNQQLARAFGLAKAAVPSSVRNENINKSRERVNQLLGRQ